MVSEEVKMVSEEAKMVSEESQDDGRVYIYTNFGD